MFLKKFALLILLFTTSTHFAFCGWTHGNISDNHGHHYDFHEYRSNDLIEYDQYKRQQADAEALGLVVGLLIAKGIQTGVVASRDKSIGVLMKGYTFKKHKKYMCTIAESNRIHKNHKNPIGTLFNDYYNYRCAIDKETMNEIHQFPKPKIQYIEFDLDLTKTPYMKNEVIEKWVSTHYKDEVDQDSVLDIIYSYKKNRLTADAELSSIYFNILNS